MPGIVGPKQRNALLVQVLNGVEVAVSTGDMEGSDTVVVGVIRTDALLLNEPLD
jgi:hypothetical protein